MLDTFDAAFSPEGCNPQQARLLRNWVTAEVMDADTASLDHLYEALKRR